MHDLRVLSVVPRVADPSDATRAALAVIQASDELDLDGILIFTGSGALLDPWVAAGLVAASTRRLVPLVALSPLYSHPFAAARSILSIAEVYGRRVDLNLITGASLSEMRRIKQQIDHAARYDRLREYAELVRDLLKGRPVSRAGRFYPVEELHLTPALPADLEPRLYVAGDSDDARRTRIKVGATSLGMWPTDDAEGAHRHAALHVGVLARATSREAERAADKMFPDDPIGRTVFKWSMTDTDSTWKRRLVAAADRGDRGPVRLLPFTAMQADGPYLVGDHDTVVGEIRRMQEAGVRTILVDTPGGDDDLFHFGVVLERLREHAG